jgi:hypothetical protein
MKGEGIAFALSLQTLMLARAHSRMKMWERFFLRGLRPSNSPISYKVMG